MSRRAGREQRHFPVRGVSSFIHCTLPAQDQPILYEYRPSGANPPFYHPSRYQPFHPKLYSTFFPPPFLLISLDRLGRAHAALFTWSSHSTSRIRLPQVHLKRPGYSCHINDARSFCHVAEKLPLIVSVLSKHKDTLKLLPICAT